MCVIRKRHNYHFCSDERGWTLLMDGFALYRGLSIKAIVTLMKHYRKLETG